MLGCKMIHIKTDVFSMNRVLYIQIQLISRNEQLCCNISMRYWRNPPPSPPPPPTTLSNLHCDLIV